MDANDRTHNRIYDWSRWLLLALILMAFARLLWAVDARNLWWDESLTLQRAESALGPLLRGRLTMQDGVSTHTTTDQHPFLYFLFTGVMLRLAGDSEFVLRWVAIAAATLMVPTAWTFARGLVRREVIPQATPSIAAMLMAASPFLLWYGQEARPYTLWAWLAVFCTYLLWRAVERTSIRWGWLVGYLVALPFFLSSHYFAIFLLPVHVLLLLTRATLRHWRVILIITVLLACAGLAVAVYAYLTIMGQPGAGGNFAAIKLEILFPDLLNAFSLGLSVDIDRVWWVDLFFAGLALVGTIWGVRNRQSLRAGGWLLPAAVLFPVFALVVANSIQPIYMNARHMSLISGFFLLLVGSGIGLLWQRWRWLGGLAGVIVIAAMLYSTFNYYVLPRYQKPDYAGMGEELRAHVQPGDIVLLNSPLLWRIFHYYLPLDESGVPWRGVPLVRTDWPANEAALEDYREQYQRIWIARSSVNSFWDPSGNARTWADENLFQIGDDEFFHPTAVMELFLYLPGPPIRDDLPSDMSYALNEVIFGDLIRLHGYDVDEPLTVDSVRPITLFWTPVVPVERQYKYVLQLEAVAADGSTQVLATTEREPYNGFLPTSWWTPGPYIFEYTELPTPPIARPADSDLRMTLQIYDLETLEKLPVTQASSAQVADDGVTLILPYP